MQPVYGSEVDPVSGVMVDFGNDEAIKKAKDEAKAGKDGSDVEAMMWDNSKRLFAIAWVRTGEAPLDTVMELVGGPDRLANVVELGESGNATFYFCTYPSEDAEGLSEQSAEKYTRLCNDLDTAKKNIITYFKGVRTEFGKITWPEKNQVVVETFFVVAIVFIFTVFIYVVDILFNALLSKF